MRRATWVGSAYSYAGFIAHRGMWLLYCRLFDASVMALGLPLDKNVGMSEAAGICTGHMQVTTNARGRWLCEYDWQVAARVRQ